MAELKALRPTDRAALALAVVGVLCVIAYYATSYLHAWLPNAATELSSIALTVAIVERIVRHEQASRVQPVLDRVLYDIGLSLRLLASSLVTDYTFTHAATYSTPPMETAAVIAHWTDGITTADRPAWINDGKSIVLADAVDFGRALKFGRDSNLDVLPPDLRVAIDDCALAIRRAEVSYTIYRGEPDDPTEPVSHRLIGTALMDFVTVFARYTRDWSEMPERTARAADASHTQVVRKVAEESVES